MEDEAPEATLGWRQQDTIWLHIGLHYWSPYRPTFQLLSFLEEYMERNLFCLEQSGIFMTEFELWSGLDRSSTWSAALFKIHTSPAPVSGLQPKLCLVQTFSPDIVELWPLPKRGRPVGSRNRRPKRAGPATPEQPLGQDLPEPPAPSDDAELFEDDQEATDLEEDDEAMVDDTEELDASDEGDAGLVELMEQHLEM
eukprot:3832704-Amphidinium_carterae.1